MFLPVEKWAPLKGSCHTVAAIATRRLFLYNIGQHLGVDLTQNVRMWQEIGYEIVTTEEGLFQCSAVKIEVGLRQGLMSHDLITKRNTSEETSSVSRWIDGAVCTGVSVVTFEEA